jgi:hypothetical protein
MPAIDHLQVLVQSRLITPSKCITDFAQSRPPSASPNSLNHGIEVYLQTRSITACQFTQSWYPTAYLQPCSIMPSKFAQSGPPPAHLQSRLITISESITKFPPPRTPIVSSNTLDYGVQVDVQQPSLMASKCTSAFPASLS